MARKIKPPDELPSKAWLMSFGDTMTTLLAFFIVLVSMAEDQTGANLHTGTGSFMQTIKSGGMPGIFSGDKSSKTVQHQATSPLYKATPEPGAALDPDGSGPDKENGIRSKDREQEEFKRLLNELDRMTDLSMQPDTTGETTFDFFNKLGAKAPYLPENYGQIAVKILPLLRKDTHRVELIVWAPTPSKSAMKRCAKQASAIVEHMVSSALLPGNQSRRIMAVCRTWPYKDIKRPTVSYVVRRVRPERS